VRITRYVAEVARRRAVARHCTRSLALGATLVTLSASPALAAWSQPQPIDPGANVLVEPTAVSCPSANFCAAVDWFTGLAYIWHGTSWAAPVTVDAPNSLTSVSCSVAGFCVALDQQGNAFTFSHGTWGPPTLIHAEDGPGAGSVSCASTSFCVAVYRTAAFTFNGSSWSEPQRISSSLRSVSCPAPGSCVAADGAGRAFTLHGGSWRAPTEDGISATQISCSSPSACVVVGFRGPYSQMSAAARMVDGVWQAPHDFGGDGTVPTAVSCTSPSFCMVTFNLWFVSSPNGMALHWNGTGWEISIPFTPTGLGLQTVSCSSASFCLTIDYGGNYQTWSGPTGTAVMAARRSRSGARSRARAGHRPARARHR